MSKTPATPPSIYRRLMAPAALNYLILWGVGLGIYFMAMMGKGNMLGAILVIVLAVPGVLARWVISPVMALIITVYLMYDPAFIGLLTLVDSGRVVFLGDGPGFDLNNVVLAASLLAYVIGHYRLNALLHFGMAEDPTPRRPNTTGKRPVRPEKTVPNDELPKTLVVAAACLIVGQAVWYLLALYERSSRPNAYGVGATRLLLVLWGFGLVLLVLVAALTYLRYSRYSRAEADMVLRDTFFQEMRRETDRLQRWRKWFKDRMARQRTAGK